MFNKYIFAITFILLGFSVSHACSCADPSVREKFRDSSIVFVGEVVSFEKLDEPVEKSFFFKVVFKVEKQWKGKKQKEIMAIAPFDNPGMCGDLDLSVGQKILVYAPKIQGYYAVYRDCGPNRYAKSAKKEIKKLNGFWNRLYYDLFPYPK